jgi:hypothetical protein
MKKVLIKIFGAKGGDLWGYTVTALGELTFDREHLNADVSAKKVDHHYALSINSTFPFGIERIRNAKRADNRVYTLAKEIAQQHADKYSMELEEKLGE